MGADRGQSRRHRSLLVSTIGSIQPRRVAILLASLAGEWKRSCRLTLAAPSEPFACFRLICPHRFEPWLCELKD
jgi:hypothetical protein